MDLDLALRAAGRRDRARRSTSFRCLDPVTAVGPDDPDHPVALTVNAIRPPSPALFVRGPRPLPAAEECVALIGARRCTDQGRAIARHLAGGLAAEGLVVVSGLALGIDAAAHEGALDAGGRTLAVLASPVDRPTPTAHQDLAEEIVRDGGWLLSERAPGATVRASEFPRRNRLVVALCAAVVVVEAGLPSGTLGTVALALEAGREVGAVPGSVLSLASRGSNLLLREGATPITCVDDALALVGRGRSRTRPDLDAEERAMLEGVPGAGAATETWLARSGLPKADARRALMRLVAKGLVWKEGSGGYTRALR